MFGFKSAIVVTIARMEAEGCGYLLYLFEK
jgi:hypothetical protein